MRADAWARWKQRSAFGDVTELDEATRQNVAVAETAAQSSGLQFVLSGVNDALLASVLNATTPLFTGCDRSTIAKIASHVFPVEVPAGKEVVRRAHVDRGRATRPDQPASFWRIS